MLNSVPFPYFKIGSTGKTRNLKMGLDAIRSAEQELGISLMYLLQNNEKLGLNAMCIMIGAGLRHEDPSMTTDKVSRWIEKYINETPGENIGTTMIRFEVVLMEAFKESGLFGNINIDEDEDAPLKNEVAGEAETKIPENIPENAIQVIPN